MICNTLMEAIVKLYQKTKKNLHKWRNITMFMDRKIIIRC